MYNYLLLDAEVTGSLYYRDYKLKPKIIRGFCEETLCEGLNLQAQWTPKPNDVLYFVSGCTVPRFKVREKFVITSKMSRATAIFANDKNIELEDVEVINELDSIDVEAALELNRHTIDKDVKTLIKSLLGNNIRKVFLTYDCWNYHTSIFSFTRTNESFGTITDLKYKSRSSRQWKKKLFKVPQNFNLLNVSTPIYSQNAILKLLGSDKMIIDANKFTELNAFGNSNNDADLLLMIELMANCNFEKSIVYLIALLREHGRKIMDLKAVEHVNFKSLLEFLNLNKYSLLNMRNVSIHHFTTVLQQRKLFTKSNAVILGYLYANDVNNNIPESSAIWQMAPILKPSFYNNLDNDDTN